MMSPRANDPPAAETIRRLLRDNYALGGRCEVEEIYGGYCNKSYRIICGPGDPGRRYLLRRYSPNVAESDIRFEHALLNHLKKKGFDLSAQVVRCRSGEGYVQKTTPGAPWSRPLFWALFTYLDGEDVYSWTRTDLTPSEFDSAAEILARFHGAGCDFVKPAGADRVQPPIISFLPEVKKAFGTYLPRAANRRCDRLFRERFNDISAAIDGCHKAAASFEGMLNLPVHGDYHPGNLKYAGGRGVGLFDFDWSKIDYRLFDVALALVYFCSSWDDYRAAKLFIEKMRRFLIVYNRTCSAGRNLPPLSTREYDGLDPMLAAANLYVLNWDLTDFYEAHAPDDDENVTYIRHNIGLMDWIHAHANDIKKLAARPLS